MAGNLNLPKENIDEVILRLLALEPNEVDELDYETYSSYLKELLIEVTSSRRKISGAEVELVKNEFKRIRGKKGRFRIVSKKSKVTANGLGIGGIRKQVRGAQQRLMLAPVGGVPAGKIDSISKGSGAGSLARINDALNSIVVTLTSIDTENKKRNERDRKDAESRRRAGRERELESKPIEGIKKVVSAITKPFQSIWDKIVNFITMVVLGRIVLKLIDWFADKKNQDKIQTIIRFFEDHWPTLLALYLRFGTGIGRFIGRLSRILVKGAVKLVALTAKLAARAGLKGAGRFARFLGGPRGAALATGLGIAADVAITAGAGAGISGLASGDMGVPGFSGGGFSGGLKNFFGNMFSGLVSGPKGRDKVPAMLTDGEFVMSTGAVQKYGVDTLEAMNAAGGGTNVPQVTSGVTYAAGGGQVGSPDFWSLAAISAKEAGGIPQGQADVAQSIYNRAQMGMHPGGRSIKNIITASGQYAPTFSNPGAWKSIINKNTAVKAVGNDYASRLDMAVKSITNPKLQGEAARFVGSRTDFRGESQKKYMDRKKGDITRGGGHNFFGWMTDNAYTSKLPKPASVPNIVSSQSNTPTTSNTSKPKQDNSFRIPFTNIKLSNPFSPSNTKPRDTTPRYAEGGLATQPHIQSSIKPRNIRPLPSPKPEIYNIALDGTTSSGGVNPSRLGSNPPRQSATHGNTRLAQATLGVKK